MASLRILIVNDDATFFERIKIALEHAAGDVEMTTAISAARAMGMASAKQPDAMIVDGDLVGVDGYALTEQIKADPALKGIPVVILCGKPSEVLALKARQVGAEAHLPKDLDPATIADKVFKLARPEGPAAPQASAAAEAAPVAEAPQGTVDPRLKPLPEGYGVPAPPPAGDVSVQVGGLAPDLVDESLPHIDDLLRMMVERGGSDLHITVGSQPAIRMRGDLVPIEDGKTLTPKDTMAMILALLSEEQRRRFEMELELDFAYSLPGVARFRANVLQQRNSMGAVFRVIPIHIPTFEELNLPKVCRYLSDRPRGLVLVTGPTGCGKSTTLASMVDHINDTRPMHIITVEDPIEFVHSNKKAIVTQREVGEDTRSFAGALRRVLRQDPDVIMVGELRDLETISTAITAAETGHLVLATLHTTGGPATIDRVIDVFPPHQQNQVRMQLSNTLEGVLSQTLLRSTDGRSRVLAMEIMLGIPAIRNLIREGKTYQMTTIIQGGARLGMQTMDQHLKALLTAGKITYEEAMGKAQNPKDLEQMMSRRPT